MLAFTALDMSTEAREQALREADVDNADGKLHRPEFMDLCVSLLWDKPLRTLDKAATLYAEYRHSLKRRNNTYWRGIADSVDRFSRFWIPILYITLHVVLYNIIDVRV